MKSQTIHEKMGLSLFQRLFISYLSIGIFIFFILGFMYLLHELEDNLRESKSELKNELEYTVNYFDKTYMKEIQGDLNFIDRSYSFNTFLSSPNEEIPFTRTLAEQLFLNFMHSSNGMYLSIRYINAKGQEQVVTTGTKRVRSYKTLGNVRGNPLYGYLNLLFKRLKSANMGSILVEGPFKYNNSFTFLIGMPKSDPEIGGLAGVVILHCNLANYFDYLKGYTFDRGHKVEILSIDNKLLFVPGDKGSVLVKKSNISDSYSIEHIEQVGSDNKLFFKIKLNINYDALVKHTKDAFKNAFLWLFFIIFPVLALIAFFISRYFSKPLVALTDYVDRFAKGDLSVRAKIKASGELGILVKSFNNMAQDFQKVTVSRDELLDEIKKRKKVESELQESEKRFMSVMDASPDPVLLAADGKYCECNQAAVRMFGYSSRQDILMSHPSKFSPAIQPDGRDSFEKANEMMKIVNERGFHRFEWVHHKADGEDLPSEVSLTLITLKGKNMIYGVVRDISLIKQNELALKSSQAQLLQSEKLASIGQLAAGIAHEINNPIGFISNNMEILQEYIGKYTKILGIVENIKLQISDGDIEKAKAGVDKLTELEDEVDLDFIKNDINKLLEQSGQGLERVRKIVLDLSIFTRKENAENMDLIKIEEVMDSILSIVSNELKYKAELIKEYGDIPLIRGNAQQLGQVFINLLVNAGQAIEEKGKIIIKTYQQDGYVCIDVSDTGKGIQEENLKKIFDPFFTTKPVGKGTGLGLTVSHEIIKKHGGEIRVKSKIGEGTTFTVMLPLSNHA